jgi:protocatechuate 3,4-dioxygenase beta subunit
MRSIRRTLIKAAPLLIPSVSLAAALPPTQAQTEGPFYPALIPLDADADLVQVAGKSRPATGIITHLSGSLLDQNGCPVTQAKVEIWQCDAFGAYHHPLDRGNIAEPEFQGYGHTATGSNGEYRFRTIRPVSYPGRTPHIHVKVSKPGMISLTTQLYIEGEPLNQRDFLFNRIPEEKRQGVMALFPAASTETETVTPVFDIVLGQTVSCA